MRVLLEYQLFYFLITQGSHMSWPHITLHFGLANVQEPSCKVAFQTLQVVKEIMRMMLQSTNNNNCH